MLKHEIKSIATAYTGAAPESVASIDLIDDTPPISSIDKTIKLTLTGNYALGTPELDAAVLAIVTGTPHEPYFV